ncbi:MAG TPA: choice-of-anchor P family protein [Acidimicrobiales bacterium]|jgi:hypothetical protein|nr:choice-of-anchor P family protein [Acidimicrobiales bacterium]
MRPHRAFAALGAFSVVAAATLVGPGAGGQAADDATDAGYAYYLLRATGQGVVAGFTVNGLLPVDDLVSLSSVTAESTFGSNGSSALAALPDPGDLIRTLPGTLSGLTGVEGLPPYPAAAAAEYPAVPDDEVQFAPDGGVGAGRLTAHADETAAAATAATTDIVDVVGLLPSFSIGSIRATTTSSKLRDGAFRSLATTTVSDLRLLGGLLRIDQVTSEVTTELVDGRPSATASKVDVSGAEIAGQPVGITDKGIVALGQSVALAPVVSSLTAPIADRGIAVHTTPARESVGDGEATATGGSLVIEMPIDVQGRPGRFTLTLARAESHLEASGDDATPDVLGTVGDIGGGLGAPLDGTALAPLPAGSVAIDASGPPSPSTDLAAGPADAPRAATAPGAVAAVSSVWDTRPLYRATAVAALLMLVMRRLLRRYTTRDARSSLRPLWRW